jgi:hypothetical protein
MAQKPTTPTGSGKKPATPSKPSLTKLRPPAGSKDVTSHGFGMAFIGAKAFRPKKP